MARMIARAAGLVFLAFAYFTSASAAESPKVPPARSDVPAWLFPMNPAGPPNPPPYGKVASLHVPNSNVTFSEAELNDLFSTPDWHPESHGAMPPIVAVGHPPDVYACGFCHTAGGQGRPENAALAGLSAAYILNQAAILLHSLCCHASPSSRAHTFHVPTWWDGSTRQRITAQANC